MDVDGGGDPPQVLQVPQWRKWWNRTWAWIRSVIQRVAPRLTSKLAPPVRPESLLPQPITELVSLGGGPASPLPAFERDEEELLPHGDFSGADEAQRFAALPPIAPDAVDDVDWDALARDLTRNA